MFYTFICAFYLIAYISILCASYGLRWTKSSPQTAAKVRIYLLSQNLFILLALLGAFEIKNLMAEGLHYFDSFWNKNDMMLFLLSVAALVQEIKILIDGKEFKF